MGLVEFLKNEPVLVAAVLSAAATIAGSLAVRQGEVGVIAGAFEVVLAALARTQTYPANKIKASADLLPNITLPPKQVVTAQDMAHGKLPD